MAVFLLKMEAGDSVMVDRIWEHEPLDEYELEELTKGVLIKAAKSLDVILPDFYVELMRTQNGGRLFKNSIEINKKNVIADHLLGIGSRKNEGILITPYMIKEWGLPNDIVLISGGGHSWFFLDYRQKKEEPCVSFIDREEGIETIVASNLKEFIDKLSRDSENNEFELVSESSYTTGQLESEVEKGGDPFLITDSFLYYSVVDCDFEWLMSQAIIVMDNPDEFIAPEVMAYTMKKIANTEPEKSNRASLVSLAEKIKNHKSVEVRKYYKKIRSYIK